MPAGRPAGSARPGPDHHLQALRAGVPGRAERGHRPLQRRRGDRSVPRRQDAHRHRPAAAARERAAGPGGAFFAHAPIGGYRPSAGAVRMRDGTTRTVPAIRHIDERAAVLQAAICDDELIQAIGRGRGVNRTADNPLEVHLLADVALPLVHDEMCPGKRLRPTSCNAAAGRSGGGQPGCCRTPAPRTVHRREAGAEGI